MLDSSDCVFDVDFRFVYMFSNQIAYHMYERERTKQKARMRCSRTATSTSSATTSFGISPAVSPAKPFSRSSRVSARTMSPPSSPANTAASRRCPTTSATVSSPSHTRHSTSDGGGVGLGGLPFIGSSRPAPSPRFNRVARAGRYGRSRHAMRDFVSSAVCPFCIPARWHT